MGVRVFIVEPLKKWILELDPHWGRCPKSPSTSSPDGLYPHRAHGIEFRDVDYAKARHYAQRTLRRMLPPELVCGHCGDTIKTTDLPATMTRWTRDGQPYAEKSVQVSGSLVFRRVDDRKVLYEIVPGMAYDTETARWPGWKHRSRTGRPLGASLPVPFVDHEGKPAKCVYGWEWVQACKAAGTWLPDWHIALPNTRRYTPEGYRGDAVFPINMYASNGQDMHNGYTSGWHADQWLDPTTMTLSPSIWHNKGGPTDWHGWLQGGVLNPA